MRKLFVVRTNKALFGVIAVTAADAKEFIIKYTGNGYNFTEGTEEEQTQYEQGKLSFTSYFNRHRKA